MRLSKIRLLLALLPLTLAGVAAAAPISQVSWNVTGGSFGGGIFTSGPITGGAVTFTPVGGSISTPALGGTIGGWTLTLSGPSGAASRRPDPATGGRPCTAE